MYIDTSEGKGIFKLKAVIMHGVTWVIIEVSLMRDDGAAERLVC